MTTDESQPELEGEPEAPEAWDRRPSEPPKCYEAFRFFRDLLPHQRRIESGRINPVIEDTVRVSTRTIRKWALEYDWTERAGAWDDACHHAADVERLEAIRAMHAVHATAGRAAVMKACEALDALSPSELTPQTIARLLELGARLERSTLVVSVEELQGLDQLPSDVEDPWEKIARELDPLHAARDAADTG